MDLIVTAREVRYAGKQYLKGDTLSIDEASRHGASDIRVLKVLRKVEDAPVGAPVGEVVTQVAPPEAAAASGPAVEPEPAVPEAEKPRKPSVKPKGPTVGYLRRDLRAED